MLKFIFWWFWPCRWVRALSWAFRGVRIMPSALLLGRIGSFKLGCGVKIGARSRLITHRNGRIVIGKKTWMSTDVEVEADGKIFIGANTTVQRRCAFHGTVRIGRGCLLAPNIFMSSHGHAFHVTPHLPIREQERLVAQDPDLAAKLDRPVWVQDDCWLGINVFVGPGVTIGKGSIIGANSVIMSDVPPYSVVVGVPGRVIDHRLEWVPGSVIAPAEDLHRPYVLSGEWIAAQDGEAAKIRMTPDEPLLVALAQGTGKSIVVQYKIQEKIKVNVNGAELTLRSRESEFTISSDILIPQNDSWVLDLRIVEASGRGSMLDILRIEWR